MTQPGLERGIFRTQVYSVITASNHLAISSFPAVLNWSACSCLRFTFMCKGVGSWSRYCATSRKVTGLIPEGFIETFYSLNLSARPITLGSKQTNRIFVVVPCILIILKFFSPTNAPFYYTYKMLKRTVKISHAWSYMFRSIWTIFREPCNFSKARYRLPEEGPDGPKHVGTNMRYFNCTF
jgi:hypothetical protein